MNRPFSHYPAAAIPVLALLLLSGLIACTDVDGQTPRRTHTNALEAQMDAYLAPYVELGLYNGAILIAQDGEVLLSKGYGMADYARQIPNTPQTRFRLASVSKPFTNLAIAQLWEQGRLTPEATLDAFVPDYPRGDEITLNHLIRNRSGVPHINRLPWYQQREKHEYTLEDLIDQFKHEPLDFDPGTQRSYSNGGFVLVAYVIEQVSGQSFGAYLDEHIFHPLDMHDTGHERHDEQVDNLAVGYVPGTTLGERVPAGYVELSLKIGGGSLYSTVEDLYRWDRALVAGTLLKPATRDQLFMPDGDGEVGYSGRAPGFNAIFERHVADDLTVIVLANNYASIVQKITDDLEAMVRGEAFAPIPFDVGRQIDPDRLAAFAGPYQWPPPFNTKFEVYPADDGSTLLFSDATGAETALVPVTKNQFILPLYGAAFTFVTGNDGAVSHIRCHFVWNPPETAFAIQRLDS